MFEISQMLSRKCQQTFPGFWVAGGQFRPFGPPSTIRATTYARHRSTGASGSRVDDCFRRILVVAACCGKGPFQRSFADLHRRALPKNWSLLRARPGKPPEGKTSRMLPAFCRASRGVTRRHKGVALPAILHAPCLGAFLKQALEYSIDAYCLRLFSKCELLHTCAQRAALRSNRVKSRSGEDAG